MPGLKAFRLLSLIVLLLAAQPHAYSQESEEQLKEQAATLFEAGKFIDATSLYLRLLALNPRSHDYNYRYGTCLLYNSYKKQDAFKYLTYAVTSLTIDVQAFYFLGKAYHLNYQFNEAIKNYDLYKQKSAGKFSAVASDVDRQIEMCQNGKRLLTTITDLIVLERKESDLPSFFRKYSMNDIGGDILVAADYQSKVDKKKGHIPIIHFPATTKAIYYSSYGDSDKGNKDIYVKRKLPDGSWGAPQPVAGSVNTKYDEDFPYMNPNGEYLYFCSKGHNSMGGYDVFRSKLNPETNSFGPPENMDFAISSPDDDLLYVVDSLDRNAYFASSRQSSNGSIYVYKVRVERVPLQLAVVKGQFASAINPENRKITITVTDFASGEKIGTFTSNEKGGYLVTFPKGGKYTYEMKVDGSAVSHKAVVTVPFLKEFKPLKQKIDEERLEGSDVVKVTDLFGEDVDDPMGVLAEVIKLRSELNPNANQFNLEQLDAGADNKKILAELGFEDAGPQGINAAFEKLEDKQQEKVALNENLVNGALTAAVAKLDEAAKKVEEAKTLVNRGNSAPTKEQKFTLFMEAQEKVNQVAELKAEARSLIAFADSVAKKGTTDKELLSAIEAIAAEVKKEVAADNIPELKNLITANARTIEAVKNNDEKDPADVLTEQKMAVQKSKTGFEQQRDSYAKTEEQLKAEIGTLKASLDKAKAKDKPGIESAIASKTNEMNMVSEEIQNLEKKIAKSTTQEEALTERIRFLQNVTQVNGAAPVSPAEVQNRLTAVDSKNNNTLAAYIAQQVADQKKDPALQAIADAGSGNADPVAEALADDYEDRIADIGSEQFATPAEKTEKLLEADNALAEEIASELEKTEAALEDDPNDKAAQSRKAALTQLQEKNAARIAEREKMLAAQNATPAVAITPETELETLAPDYEQTLAATNGATPKATLEARNALDATLIGKLDDALAQANNKLRQDPANAPAKERVKALTVLKTEAQDRIDERETALAQLEETPSASTTTPEKELAALAPNYEKELDAAIGETPEATLEAQNAVDRALVGKIDAALVNVENTLENNPGDRTAKDRKAALLALKDTAEERIADREARIAGEDPEEITPENELAALMPDYDEQLDAAVGETKAATLAAQNTLDKKLVAQIDSELEDVEGQLLRNPDNTTAKQRQEALEILKEEAEERIAERDEAIADATEEPAAETSLAELAERIRPEYRENIGKIEATMDDGTKKNAALLNEEKYLLAAIEKQLAKKEAEAAKNPEDADVAQEVKELKAAQAVQEALVSERELDFIAIEQAQIVPARLQSDVLPGYRAPNVGERENYSADEIAAFTAQEQELQDALVKRLRANEKKLAKSFDPKLAAENKVITALMEQSVNRAQTLGTPVTEDDAVREAIAADLGADAELLMESDPETVGEAKRIITELKTYEAQLSGNLEQLEGTDPQDEAAIARVEEQLAVVRRRIGTVEADLDNMESSVEAVKNPGATAAEQAVAALDEKETQLEKQLADPALAPAEKRSAEKELATVRTEKKAQETIVLQESLTAAKNERQQLEAPLTATSDPTAKAALGRSAGLTAAIPTKPTNRDLRQQVQQEEQAAVLLQTTTAYLDAKRLFDEKGFVTATRPELEAQKRRFAIEIGQLELVIRQLKDDPEKTEELAQAKAQQRGLQRAVETIDEMLEQLDAEKAPENPLKKGLETTLSYEREAELAASPEYAQLLESYRGVQSTQRQLTDVIKEKEAVRNRLATADPDAEDALIEAFENLSKEEQTLRTELEQQHNALETKIAASANPDEFRNLLAREVVPVKPVVSAQTLPGMTTGFELSATPPETRAEKNIPVDLKLPTGLVYRVQVGAFAKPIPEDLFREFTPVTGEKLTNGITRYLAGYFGNRTKVVDAQRQIRALGYADAFVVAYCDGNRISLAEARRLEDLGLCVPKNQDSLLLEVVENTIAQLPADSAQKFRPVIRPSDYNKAPGAAVAEAAEDRKGLYYTVQVGVYNRPVPAEQVKNIAPLITKRLPNGQIRYSSGVFQSIEAARPKRAEAIARGIADAFVTAYYNGERISLDEAKRLLADQGTAILEQDVTTVAPDAIAAAQQYASSQPAAKKTQQERVQFVSQERYNAYPREAISRLNSHGSFYFDAQDGRIKSVEYVATDAVTMLELLAGELDTVQTAEKNALPVEPTSPKIVAVWESPEMSGPAANWLLRLTIPHAGTATENGFVLTFEGIPSDEQQDLIDTLESYGAARVSREEEKTQ